MSIDSSESVYNMWSSFCFEFVQKTHKHLEHHKIILDILISDNQKDIVSLILMEMIKNELISMQHLLNVEFCEFVMNFEEPQVINLINKAIIQSKIIDNNLNIKIDFPTFYKGHFELVSAISIPFFHKNSTYEMK